MKTIIFPCNGQTASLEMVRKVMDVFSDEELSCIFLELRPLPDNYNDLVTISKRRSSFPGFDASFTEALRALHSSCPQKSIFSVDHIYGDSAAVFRNYVDHRGADLVVYDNSQWLADKNFSAKDVFRMVSRSGREMIYISSAIAADGVTLARPAVKIKIQEPVLQGASVAGHGSMADASAPASVKQQFQSVDTMLNELEINMLRENMVTRKFSNLSRYFLREGSLQKILDESKSSFLWIK